MAAVSTFAPTLQVHPILPVEDIKGYWKTVIGSHKSDWPSEEVVHKMEGTCFLGRRKYNNIMKFQVPIEILNTKRTKPNECNTRRVHIH